MEDAEARPLPDQNTLIERATDIVAAYVSNNSLPASEVPGLLVVVYSAISGLGSHVIPVEPKAERATPAQIRKSITHYALISFEDGKSYKTLKRHLTKVGLTPEDYREKWGLPRDYPMTATSYSESRSALAKSLGLGQRRQKAAPKAAEVDATPAEKPARARKTKKVAAAAE